MRFTLDQLRKDPRNWTRFYGDSYRYYEVPWRDIVPLAFNYFDQIEAQTAFDRGDESGLNIDGALRALQLYIRVFPDETFEICRRVGSYFSSCNINVAFGTIRKFEFTPLSQYIMFVSDQLIGVATCQNPVQSPVEMTVRGIAFRVLFLLDPGYKFWPSLRIAREECIRGLLTWGSGRPDYQKLAEMIRQYTVAEK